MKHFYVNTRLLLFALLLTGLAIKAQTITPANDFTVTSMNVAVSGDASANDLGAAGGTFAIVSQPASGTISINAATGQYTYTPASTFTGVATATYNLCGGAPVSCSNAAISITVYPDIIANPDLITTSSLATKTGSLLSNDTGITAGASYSVTAAPVSSTTGTLVVDAATGHYTFTPASLFLGSVQTTYTVCNVSVTPPQCAVTTITITVSDLPLAINDNTTTLMNVPVSGNVGSNDTGTLLATYTFSNTSSATGTLTGNPLTGAYTFTPASGFTGTVTTTYSLCVLSLLACSTASITFTVYPNLVANADVINTTPPATVTGSLLANDTGIVPGASYTVSVTQPSASTGTISFDPQTGTYTFTPNPSFTGIASASYTVCNISVTPNQCSSATIAINASPNPAPVNDQVATVINTSVTGNAAANDSGTSGGTFSIINQPASGTITINTSTGQFTYTPASTFTGVTTATYNLCNGAPVTCSNAVISITVYPNLIAVNDIINTTPLTVQTGSLLSNDIGVTPGGTYSVSFTQIPSATGTLAVNSATGQYTFTPGILFTGTAQTTYTVCNTGINPQQCSSASITIIVSNLPFAVNDATATIINTSVSGNAGANDSGTLAATFNFGNVSPGTGTLVGGSLTGLYSYTPAANFTGTASATYTLCDPLALSCVTANITFTVYPLLTAIADVINTTPSVSVTGTLLANDIGITAGGNYTVTVTQPAASSGTISFNPQTGAYTFTPNSAFTGTAQASYTVCNISVVPSQCSNTTITINVSPNPVPADDHIATTINTSVTGNAAANDIGATGGTFAITGQPANGTVAISASTGQFTFTPATGFIGVTTATYQLCNGAPASCSTAVISVTVYPVLTANADLITTTPSATATGSLLANDAGIIPGGSYPVSITPPPGGTGTLTVNPATGEYTFIPNPAFTGTAQASYTVCNAGIVPQVCSSATIKIQVGYFPIAANDFTQTLTQLPVSGNVAANDSFTVGGTFTFDTPAASTGSLAGNSATGDYTFTPAIGFTGTTSVTYTLCTPYSPPCSTAAITFTVYPFLNVNPDLISAVMNTSVTGNLESNDSGTVTGQTYSLGITAIAASAGILTADAATGQYTFIPAANFTGSTTTTYTLAQFDGTTQIQIGIATVSIVVTSSATPSSGSPLGIAKSISSVTYSNNGTFRLTYKLTAKNYGTQPLSNVSITDDLSSAFPAPSTYTVIGTPTIASASSQLYLSSSFNGTGVFIQLTSPNASTIAPGHTDTLLFTVEVMPNGLSSYRNSATISSVNSGSTVTDSSANGLDPDPDGDGDPGNNSTPTTFTLHLVKIGIAKYAELPISTGGDCYDVSFKFTVKNFGSSPIYNVQLIDSLDKTFTTPQATYNVVGTPASVNGYLQVNNLFNGSGNYNLIAGNSTLGVGQTDTILLNVHFCTQATGSFSNLATTHGSGEPNGGYTSYDISENGLTADPNGDNNPGEWSYTEFSIRSVIRPPTEPEEGFQIPEGFSPNGDGINDRFEIKGVADLHNIEVTILNRWGNKVYNKKPYDNSWDGKSNEGLKFGGDDLPEGTYYYLVDLGNGQKVFKGYVYINRR